MARKAIDRIREKTRLQLYDMTVHAMEEMAEENLDILDIEHAMRVGKVARIEKNDPRGTKYIVEGVAADGQTPVGVVGRFTTAGRYLIITVYEMTCAEE